MISAFDAMNSIERAGHSLKDDEDRLSRVLEAGGAEIARLRAELEFNCIRIDAILIEKRAEAAERARIRAEREAEERETQAKASAPSSTSATPAGRGRESPTVSSPFHGEVARSGAERRRGS